jgi:predicted HAD superfamily phosphohydrolase YqeG
MCLIGESLHTDVFNLRGYIPMCFIGERVHTDVLNLREVTYRCA